MRLPSDDIVGSGSRSSADHTELVIDLHHFILIGEFLIHGVKCVDDRAVVLCDDFVLVDGLGGEESLPGEGEAGLFDL